MAGSDDVSSLGHDREVAVTLDEASADLTNENEVASVSSNQIAASPGRLTNESSGSTNPNQDELIQRQQEEIAASIAKSSLLITRVEDLTSLAADFQNDQAFTNKISQIAKEYSKLRLTRPDGNCFFRGFGFRLFEYLLGDEKRLDEFRSVVSSSKDEMVELGMPPFTVEDFYDNFMDNLDRLKGESKMSINELEDLFNDEGLSNYIVVFLRLLVSKQLQKEADFYQNFIEGDILLKDFCATEVEPMFKESDHIHIIGLTADTGVSVRVIYLDRDGEKVQNHDFPDGSDPMVHLIYRPGHYDIIYQ